MKIDFKIKQVILRDVKDLKVNPRNPRKITSEKYEKLRDRLKERPRFLELKPIILDENDVVLGGNMRLLAIKELKFEQVPTLKATDFTEEEIKEFIVVDNLGFGIWDYDILGADYEVGDLEKWGFDIGDEFDLTSDDFDLGKELDNFTVPVTTYGDLYEIGEHRILCGDSTNSEDIARLMRGGKAKMIFTSPPYNMAGKMYENYKDNLKSEEYIKFNLKVIDGYIPYLRGFLFWNISYNRNSRWEFIEIMHRIIKETGLKFLELIVWDKGHGMPISSRTMVTRQYEDVLLAGTEEEVNRDLELMMIGTNSRQAWFNKSTNRGITNYWRIDTNKTQIANHFACFPVDLPMKGIQLMSNPEDIVVDPFGGSFSTLVACERVGRHFYGMEMDPKYCDVGIKRLIKENPELEVIKNGNIVSKELWLEKN